MRLLLLSVALVASTAAFACGDRNITPGAVGDDDDDDDDDDGGSSGDADNHVGPAKNTDPYDPDTAVGTRGTCTQSKSGTAGLVLQGKVLLPGGEIAEQGEVFIKDGLIACAGDDCSGEGGYGDAGIVTCQNTVISPGLINSHDHITYVNSPPQDAGDVRYDHRNEWRLGLNGKPPIFTKSTDKDFEKSAGELRFVLSGATSTNGSGSASHLLRNLDKTAGREGLTGTAVDYQTFPLGSTKDNMSQQGCAAYQRLSHSSMEYDSAFAPHLSEGINLEAHNEFTCATGADDAKYDIVEPQTAVIHGVAVTAADVATYRDQRSVVIWSPRSNVSLYGDTAQVGLYDNGGVPVALGTDWLPSGSMNMSRELRCAADLNALYFNRHFNDVKLWQMVTENAAMAMGVQFQLGYLKRGFVADVALFSEEFGAAHTAVVNSTPSDVMLVMRGGKPLYGDKAVLELAAVGGSVCEDLTICGVDKKACVREDGKDPATQAYDEEFTLEKLTALALQTYPLESCRGQAQSLNGQDMIEPSCVPFRPDEYDRERAEDDADGDGVKDPVDNCTYVFNPRRPMWNNEQGDTDGDGIGDACDVCPNEEGEACEQLDWDDADGDGKKNWEDNCPDLANPGQEDSDGNGIGDECTPIPGVLLTIPELRDPASPKRPADGLMVKIENVRVQRARSANGFFIQSSADQPYSGVFVYLGSSPLAGVSIGDTVTVEGKFQPFNGMDEITRPTVTILTSGAKADAYPPLPKTIAEAQSKEWQSMLLQISNVTVSNLQPDSTDRGEFVVKASDSASTIRIGPKFFPNLVAQIRDTLSVNQTITTIVGTQAFDFSNTKLWPYDKNDFTGLP